MPGRRPRRGNSSRPAVSSSSRPAEQPPASTDETPASTEENPPAEQSTAPASSPVPSASEHASQAAAPIPSTPTAPTPPPSAQRTNSSTRGRVKPPLPRSIVRRSQEARAAQERAEAERRRAEQEAKAREEVRTQKRNARGRGRGRGQARGGYIGQTERPRQEVSASGPFSLGQALHKPSAGKKRVTASRRAEDSTADAASPGTTAAQQSSERKSSTPGVKLEPGTSGEVVYIKPEDGGYISSDNEEEAGVERRNVDELEYIDLTAEESFAPIRVHRVEHKERALGLNADGATAIEGGSTAGDVDVTGIGVSDKRKGKQRSNDIQITQEQQRWQGHWRDSSESDDDKLLIKEEPLDDDTAVQAAAPDGTAPAGADARDRTSSPEAKRKAKERVKRSSSAATAEKPVFATADESAEWDRHQEDLHLLRSELGELAVNVDVDGDIAMNGAGQQTRDQRANKVYLFQFPPVLPDLVPASANADTQAADGNDQPNGGPASHNQPMTNGDNASSAPKLPSGLVGKLRVHKSGKAYLDWGGTSLQVGMGTRASFLQDVLVANLAVKPEKEEFGGSAIAMGQVKGKFVVTPDWGSILG